MKIKRKSNALLTLVVLIWLVAIGTGLHIVLGYETTAGAAAAASAEWPAGTGIHRKPGLPTLVMMVHPHCPCSRATVEELNVLMTRSQGKVDAHVLFVKPESFTEEWAKSDIWNSVAMIPGVEAGIDDRGVEARRFGSKTSGQVMLYDAEGTLVFSGGITAVRGHLGDNAGLNALLSLLEGNAPAENRTPVYGCPLFGKARNDSSTTFCNAPHTN